MTFTSKQLNDFRAYEEVRAEGDWNMFAPQAQEATGLTKDEYLYVMTNYVALRKAVELDDAS